MAIIQLLQEPLESRGLELVELGRMLRQPQWRWHCASAPGRCDAEGHAWRPKKKPDYDAARGILYCIHFQGLILKVFKVSQKVLWPPRALGTMYVYICDSVIFCMALFSRFSGS